MAPPLGDMLCLAQTVENQLLKSCPSNTPLAIEVKHPDEVDGRSSSWSPELTPRSCSRRAGVSEQGAATFGSKCETNFSPIGDAIEVGTIPPTAPSAAQKVLERHQSVGNPSGVGPG